MSARITHCKKCGAEVKYIRTGYSDRKVCCDPGAVVYYKHGDETVCTPNGQLVQFMALTGDECDAVGIGYRVHNCAG